MKIRKKEINTILSKRTCWKIERKLKVETEGGTKRPNSLVIKMQFNFSYFFQILCFIKRRIFKS